MEISFIFYIFAAFIFIPGMYFLMSRLGKSLAGGIAALGMLVFFILFGIQTFNGDGTFVSHEVVTNWPPAVNQCPDFLTLFKMPAVDTTAAYYVCVDTVGVAPQSTTNIQKFVPSNSSSLPAANQRFTLSDDRTTIIQECKDKKVTWEGVWDGLQQYTNTIPPPPSA